MLGDGVAAVLVNDIKRGIKIGEVLGAAFEVGGAVLLGKALGQGGGGVGDGVEDQGKGAAGVEEVGLVGAWFHRGE